MMDAALLKKPISLGVDLFNIKLGHGRRLAIHACTDSSSCR